MQDSLDHSFCMALLSEDTLLLLAKLDKSIPENSPATELFKRCATVGGI